MASRMDTTTSLGSAFTQMSIRNRPDFVEDTSIPDNLRCDKCRAVLFNPQQTLCGHRMCKLCVDEMRTNHGRCILEHEDGEEGVSLTTQSSVYVDRAALREISKLHVYCPYMSCKEQPTFADYQTHLNSCQKAPAECPNTSFGCKANLTKGLLQRHLADECKYRNVECEDCGASVLKSRLRIHKQDDCTMAPVTCDHCGKRNIHRGELNGHMQTCLERPTNCRYQPMGCLYQCKFRELAKHEKDEVPKHLELVTVYAARQDLDKADMREQLQMAIKAVDTLKKENSSLNQKLKILEHRLVAVQRGLASQIDLSVSVEERKANKEEIVTLQTRVQQREQQEQNVNFEQLEVQVAELKHQLEITEAANKDLEQKLLFQENVSYDGTLLWRIGNFKQRRQEAIEGRTNSLYSKPFYAGRRGYKMSIRVYPNGDGSGRNTHLSVFFLIMRSEYDALLAWPFQQKVTIILLDQTSKPESKRDLIDSFQPDKTSSSFQRPTSENNIASGCPKFATHENISKSGLYLKDDAIFLKVVVDMGGLVTL